jgi:hypothetical protein
VARLGDSGVRATELAGFIGTGIAGAAYVPQIWHLTRERCSAGLSRVAFGAWLASSLLITAHAVAIGAVVFIALGVVQLAAITVILVFTGKYAGSYCASHVPAAVLAQGASTVAAASTKSYASSTRSGRRRRIP